LKKSILPVRHGKKMLFWPRGKGKGQDKEWRKRNADLSLSRSYTVIQTVGSVALFHLLSRGCSFAKSLMDWAPFPCQQSTEVPALPISLATVMN